MTLDRAQIDFALQKLSRALPEPPRWIILLNRDGDILGQIGEFRHHVTRPLADQAVASLTHAHALHEIEMLDNLNHGNFQFSVSIGGSGIYFMFNLNDTYVLGLSYQHIGVRSIDAILDGVLANFQELLETIHWFNLTG